MPADTKWTPRGIEWRFYGVVTLREIEQANSRFAGDSRASRARYQLIDLRSVERLDAAPKDLTLVGAFDRVQARSTPKMRIAFLVSDDRFDAHLEVYRSMIEGTPWQARTFLDETELRAWVAEAG